MHQATIPSPQSDKSRIINSTMLSVTADPSDEPVSDTEREMFLTVLQTSGTEH
jgi:hypothetical protein